MPPKMKPKKLNFVAKSKEMMEGKNTMLIVGIVVVVVLAAFCLYKSRGAKKAQVHPQRTPQQEPDVEMYGDPSGAGGGTGLRPCSADDLSSIMKSPRSVVAFTAQWCGHCKAMKPTLESAAYKTATPMYVADGDEMPEDLLAQLGINGYPTLMRFENGNATMHEGGRDEDSIVAFADGN